MNKKLTTLIGGIALISSAAFAEGTVGSTSDSSGVTSTSQQDTMGSEQQSPSQDSGISSIAPQGFTSLDKDNSGEISRREAASQQSLSRIFDRADENKDGQLSQSEYQEALAPESSSVN